MSLEILGTGSALPELVVTNDDLATFLDTSDEWISSRTGIRERRILNGETVEDLSVQAAKLALQDAGVAADELDYILCATLGGDYITPPLACLVQKGIGASCPAVDIGGACSGFLFALDMASAQLAKGARKVLVVGGEGLTQYGDWTDRSTCVLFGDGAGAAVVGQGDKMPYIKVKSVGWTEPLYLPASNGNMPKKLAPNRKQREGPYIRMDGQEVYKFAVRAVAEELTEAMETLGLAPRDVDHVILHQANLRIIDAARKKLGIPQERYHVNIDRLGNTSAASVPILLDECNRAGKLKKGDKVILNAFGGGMTMGTAVVEWRK